MTKKRLRKIEEKKIYKECYDLDLSFIKWLNSRLKIYLKGASNIIDLTFYKFEFKGENYTQEELIKKMIKLSDEILVGDWIDEGYSEKIDELLDIWKLVFKVMWW